MKVQTAKRLIQLQKWALQIKEHEQSGQPVRQWCRENSVAVKSFYYHKKRVQEEILDTMGTGGALQIAGTGLGHSKDSKNQPHKMPVFTALPIPQAKTHAAVTVRMGDITVDIQNSADNEIIEQVLRLVVRL